MKYLIPFLVLSSVSVFAGEERIATLLSRYGEWKQTCDIKSLSGTLSIQGKTYYRDNLVSDRTDSQTDTTGFTELSKRLVNAPYVEDERGSEDALYMVSVVGAVDGSEKETPIYATGERNLESSAPEATDFFYNVNFYCKNVLENALH